jgi:hypothetical protein
MLHISSGLELKTVALSRDRTGLNVNALHIL